ncbi:hypothetical protein DIPPA_70029 [Diplonema papillatum]|nr:hypothetical protein DIPPA_70029 [Diplonema papillatum]
MSVELEEGIISPTKPTAARVHEDVQRKPLRLSTLHNAVGDGVQRKGACHPGSRRVSTQINKENIEPERTIASAPCSSVASPADRNQADEALSQVRSILLSSGLAPHLVDSHVSQLAHAVNDSEEGRNDKRGTTSKVPPCTPDAHCPSPLKRLSQGVKAIVGEVPCLNSSTTSCSQALIRDTDASRYSRCNPSPNQAIACKSGSEQAAFHGTPPQSRLTRYLEMQAAEQARLTAKPSQACRRNTTRSPPYSIQAASASPSPLFPEPASRVSIVQHVHTSTPPRALNIREVSPTDVEAVYIESAMHHYKTRPQEVTWKVDACRSESALQETAQSHLAPANDGRKVRQNELSIAEYGTAPRSGSPTIPLTTAFVDERKAAQSVPSVAHASHQIDVGLVEQNLELSLRCFVKECLITSQSAFDARLRALEKRHEDEVLQLKQQVSHLTSMVSRLSTSATSPPVGGRVRPTPDSTILTLRCSGGADSRLQAHPARTRAHLAQSPLSSPTAPTELRAWPESNGHQTADLRDDRQSGEVEQQTVAMSRTSSADANAKASGPEQPSALEVFQDRLAHLTDRLSEPSGRRQSQADAPSGMLKIMSPKPEVDAAATSGNLVGPLSPPPLSRRGYSYVTSPISSPPEEGNQHLAQNRLRKSHGVDMGTQPTTPALTDSVTRSSSADGMVVCRWCKKLASTEHEGWRCAFRPIYCQGCKREITAKEFLVHAGKCKNAQRYLQSESAISIQ